MPINRALARFILRPNFFFEQVANCAGRGIRNTKLLMLVIARGRDKRELGTIRAPFHVLPFATTAYEVVTQCRAVLISRQLQSYHPGSIYFDYHPLNGRD